MRATRHGTKKFRVINHIEHDVEKNSFSGDSPKRDGTMGSYVLRII